MIADLVTIDAWVLAPVLAPALGALLVLVLDVLAPKARAATFPSRSSPSVPVSAPSRMP